MPTEPNHARLLAARAHHWDRTRRMTPVLLVLWLVTCFGTIFFARELSNLSIFGWPLSFYMAAQGASLVSLAVIAFYAWRMRVFDARHLAMLNDVREDM